jgi:hypothetical protein
VEKGQKTGKIEKNGDIRRFPLYFLPFFGVRFFLAEKMLALSVNR